MNFIKSKIYKYGLILDLNNMSIDYDRYSTKTYSEIELSCELPDYLIRNLNNSRSKYNKLSSQQLISQFNKFSLTDFDLNTSRSLIHKDKNQIIIYPEVSDYLVELQDGATAQFKDDILKFCSQHINSISKINKCLNLILSNPIPPNNSDWYIINPYTLDYSTWISNYLRSGKDGLHLVAQVTFFKPSKLKKLKSNLTLTYELFNNKSVVFTNFDYQVYRNSKY